MRALVPACALALAACSGPPAAPASTRATSPSTPASVAAPSASTAPTTPAVTPDGFDSTLARVTAADGEVCELCVWVADSADLRARGLMDVTDLGAAEAMAFVYPRPTTTSFWMFSTPMPLSIAFFADDGAWLGDFDMTPCPGNPCASYATPDDFTVALEVPAGRLPELLIGPGSTLALLDLPCG